MKTIMILGASILQVPAIEKAKEMGLDVVVVDMNPNAVGFDIEGIKKEVISTIDTSAVLEAAIKHNIDGIMTLASDMPMQTVAKVCKELGLVGISEDTALMATNKAYMRDALKAYNVPIPLYYRVNTYEEFTQAVNFVHSKGYKCITKPADNSGSRGINLLNTNDNLKNAFLYTKQYSRSGELLVEEFMEGPEVSVETIAIDGIIHVIQITDKLTTGAPHFVELGHYQPTQFDDETKKLISEVAIVANQSIGIKDGPSHTEIKITKDGPKIVELGARLGGDCITTHLVPLSTGVNMVEACIKIAIGEFPDIQKKWSKGSAIRFITKNAGIISEINGIEDAYNVPGIVQVSIMHRIGDYISDIESSTDRIGFVISQANSAYDAVSCAVTALDKVNVLLEEE